MDLLNKVMIAGRLTHDPEVRETTNGKKVAKLSLALDPPGAGKRDANPADPIYVDVELWERNAENAGEYLKKGSAVIVEGRLKMDRWEDRETGKTRRKLLISGERMRFLNLASGGRDNGGQRERRDDRDERDDRRSGQGNQNDRRESARTGR